MHKEQSHLSIMKPDKLKENKGQLREVDDAATHASRSYDTSNSIEQGYANCDYETIDNYTIQPLTR